MISWWEGFSQRWNWQDPVLLLGVLAVMVTALIPPLVWRLGTKQAHRDSGLRAQQAQSLSRQEQILTRQRRDVLLSIVDRTSDKTHLMLLWAEVDEYKDRDRELLQAAFRSNVALALPGSHSGIQVTDDLNESSVADYLMGLERRYESGRPGFSSYEGLLDFLDSVATLGLRLDASVIVRLVTGPTTQIQRPGHTFYRELVSVLPDCASGLILRVEDIDYCSPGGLRLNVLTGVLLGMKDAELGRERQRGVPAGAAAAVFRSNVPSALAHLLHRDNLRSFDRWSAEGSTERVSATVAWLTRAVGWLADTDDHLAKRMVQNLKAAIESIPQEDRGWGTDGEDVLQGFEWIEVKQSELWGDYGPDLEAAADSIGTWRHQGRGEGDQLSRGGS